MRPLHDNNDDIYSNFILQRFFEGLFSLLQRGEKMVEFKRAPLKNKTIEKSNNFLDNILSYILGMHASVPFNSIRQMNAKRQCVFDDFKVYKSQTIKLDHFQFIFYSHFGCGTWGVWLLSLDSTRNKSKYDTKWFWRWKIIMNFLRTTR